MLLSVFVHAQIVAPMGYGLPATPQKIASYNDGIISIYANNQNEAELQVWNGDFWYKIESPQLPKLGTTQFGEFKIIDLIEYNNAIYLCAAYVSGNVSTNKNYILKWDGSSWKDLSNTTIANSESLNKLVVQNGKLNCVGKFIDNDEKYNLVELVDDAWSVKGNLITRNTQADNFTSVTVSNDKVYATGNFTAIQSGNYSLATWDGSLWEIAEFPPFLGENIVVSEYNNSVIVYGKSNFSTESVKIKNGKLWSNMSQGLEAYEVNNISHFAELKGSLFAVGSFENSNNEIINILEYDGASWGPTNLYLSDIEQLYSNESGVIVSGDFSDNARISFIGEIRKDQAQIAARVYSDKNGNCIKDSNEDWLPNYPLTLNKTIDNLNTDKFGQLYLPIDKKSYTVNASTVDYWEPTCPDYLINAAEYKTYYGAIVGVKQQIGIQDGLVYLSDNQSFSTQANENKSMVVAVENIGGQPITDATLTLTHSASISNLTSDLPFDSYIDNKISWTISLNGNEKKQFKISFTTDNPEDNTLVANLVFKDGQKDQDISNNSYTARYKTGNSLPNQKSCDNGKTIDPQEDLLKYKIGFKNVGTTQAFDIKVVDELDEDYDYNRIDAFTSHTSTLLPVFTKTSDNFYKTKLIWSFNDINIPSKESSEEGSAGFIDLLIQNKPLEVGAEICNTAKIYYSYKKGTFDEPMVTNTVCSEVGESSGIIGQNPLPNVIVGLEIGPNPVTDRLLINNTTKTDYTVSILNTIGQKMNSFTINSFEESTINMADLTKGVYFIYAEGIFVHKFIVQ
ncbi:MAG: T9SS type A sorting domain-containing protein [Bacteroidia bacterium]|nr:T9SS type A sorting domain-containing protein [Bacteroidia bacterium]NNJ56500.1 T9SS type A sorting domain-containing protein [Bacteroidia bacterium]